MSRGLRHAAKLASIDRGHSAASVEPAVVGVHTLHRTASLSLRHNRHSSTCSAAPCSAGDITLVVRFPLAATMRKPSRYRLQRPLADRESWFPRDRAITINISIGSSLVSDKAAPLLAEIHEMAPAISARAAEIEAGRRLPLGLVEALRSIGVFRMLAPQSHGGLELDLPAAVEVLIALARIDGSVGWCATITSGASIVAALLPPQTYEQLDRNGPDINLARTHPPPHRTTATPPP